MSKDEVLQYLLSNANAENAEGMRRFGINGNILGISLTQLRQFAKKIKTDHDLALQLFGEPYHEAKLLATVIADKRLMTFEIMDIWTEAFDSWDIVDQACGNLFRYIPDHRKKVFQYAKSDKEFVRRTAFSLIAESVIMKEIPDKQFLKYLPLIEKYSFDDRNFVYKAVDWALRSIGKRNMNLYYPALKTAQKMVTSSHKTRRKVGHRALRELQDEKVIAKIQTRTFQQGVLLFDY